MPVRLGGELFRGGALTITVTQPFLTVSAGPATVRKTIVVKPLLDVRLDGSRDDRRAAEGRRRAPARRAPAASR